MAELTDDSFFPSFAHPLCTQPPSAADDLLDPLQAILQRLIARHGSAQLTRLARAALAEIKRMQTAHRLATISELVAHRFHLPPHRLRARARDQRTAFCRQVAMHLCRRITGTSFTLIGRYFGRDHSTCIYACRLIDGELRRGASSDARALRLDYRMAEPRLVRLPSTGEEFAGAYREGMAGGQTPQGQSLAANANPLVERQSFGRSASD
jgi:Bacterial dnaA protein helix-turn-helix